MKIRRCMWVSRQTQEAARTNEVTIRNGTKVPVWMAFRCLYCGEYFNQMGAEHHFGKSRIQVNNEGNHGPTEMIEIRKSCSVNSLT